MAKGANANFFAKDRKSKGLFLRNHLCQNNSAGNRNPYHDTPASLSAPPDTAEFGILEEPNFQHSIAVVKTAIHVNHSSYLFLRRNETDLLSEADRILELDEY